jgi:hypothetical protein
LLWVRHFATIVEMAEAWLIERHGFRTLHQIRRDFAIRVALLHEAE